jgi:hypothetical protein
MVSADPGGATGALYTKQSWVDGRPATLHCARLLGRTFVISGSALTTLRLEDEWFEDLDDPQAIVEAATRELHPRPDLFTFWQRVPDTRPRHAFHTEWEELAVLPIESYAQWCKQIGCKTRNRIRKAEKEGLVVKQVPYDDEFARGITAIFNESPVRQGRPFPHYGKSFDTVKSQFGRYVYRESMLGAYVNGELAGFVMLADAGQYALATQIIASLRHRDKSPNNALMAKAVELCAQRGVPYLVYAYWTDDTLAEFKRRCGFEPVRVPRYWVPLTPKGRMALALGLHHPWKDRLPAPLKAQLKALRNRWYGI